MSIVVYRDGVMASDTSSFRAGVVTYNNGKIVRGPNTGRLYGFTGLYSFINKLKDWVERGEEGSFEDYASELVELYNDRTDDVVCTALIVHPATFRIDLWTPLGYEKDVNCVGYEAIGGPYELAYGALYMGATAKQAVKACIEHSEYAKGTVKTLKF